MVTQAVLDLYGPTLGGGTQYCFQSQALDRLQEAAEEFLGIMWGQIKDIDTHSGRECTVQIRDVQLWKRITGFKLKHSRCTKSLCRLFGSLPAKSRI